MRQIQYNTIFIHTTQSMLCRWGFYFYFLSREILIYKNLLKKLKKKIIMKRYLFSREFKNLTFSGPWFLSLLFHNGPNFKIVPYTYQLFYVVITKSKKMGFPFIISSGPGGILLAMLQNISDKVLWFLRSIFNKSWVVHV